jgi:hypothetical protein
MKMTATERLSKAIHSLLLRIQDYCQEVADTPIRFGLCIANQKQEPYQVLTRKIQDELWMHAKDHFNSLGVQSFYFQFWTPPTFSLLEKKETDLPLTVKDYQLTFELPEYNAVEERRTTARSLIYCPSQGEINHWWNEWFEMQDEAIRHVPLVFQDIKERMLIRQISASLAQKGIPIFDVFANKYILQSHHLGISDEDKKLIDSGRNSWKTYHPQIQDLFSVKDNLFDAYKIVQKKILKSRNENIRSLLKAFIEYVEETLIEATLLLDDLKRQLLNNLRGVLRKGHHYGYKAKNPALCLSDIECAQILNALLHQFISNPKKFSVFGEVALYIWVCQHAAFAGIKFTEKDVLEIKVTDINASDLIMLLNGEEVPITRGFADILEAWMGENKRKNKRLLLPTLTYDKIEKQLRKIYERSFGSDIGIKPRDFLMKAHVIPFARLTAKQRAEIDYQESLVKDSPYSIRSSNIKKHITESILENRSHTYS